jgi:hypothetical protein
MLRKKLQSIGTVIVVIAACAVVGAPAVSASSNQYGGPWNGTLYGWSPWVRGDYGWLYENDASVTGWALCVTAINEIGGTEAGDGVCSIRGSSMTIRHPYCGCATRTGFVRNIDAYNSGGVTGGGVINWAVDWW